MKKIFQKSSLFFGINLFVFMFLPCVINAQNRELDYTSIYENLTIELEEDLNLYSISFKNNSSNSSLSFGITASIYNDSDDTYEIDSTVHYYDKSYNLLATSNYTQEVPADKYVNLIQMSSINDIKNGYTVDDIYYYRISFDYNVSSTNSTYPSSANTPSLNSLYGSYEYVIDGYDIKINVNENNTFDITETITANFNIPKHGIFRKIPLTNTVTRLDGTTSKNRAHIKKIKVNEDYSSSIENGNKVLKIGDADRTFTGTKTYVISYNYDIGKDPNEKYDELYIDLIGNEWDTVIGNVTFTINMPKDFDSSKLGFSSGSKGSVENYNVKYTITDNVITGRYDGILNKGEALTIRAELEEGYFVGAGYQIGFSTYLLFLIPILGLIIAFILWYKFGKDEQVVETIEFYPPEGFNSLDIGYLYKGKAENQDVTSLLIYLANKGYIKIVEKCSKSAFDSNIFSIIKLKEYDGTDENERLFLQGLFKKKLSKISLSAFVSNPNLAKSEEAESNGNIEVTSRDLYNSFYKTMDEILIKTNTKTNMKKIFETNTSSKKVILILLILLSLVTIVAIPTLEYADIGGLAISLFIMLFYVPFFAIGLSSSISKGFRMLWLGLTIFSLFVFFSTLPIMSAIKYERIFLIAFIIGMCCIVGMILLLKFMPKRTKYGNEMLGKIKGFKTFLETAEKEKLEALVVENPTYFYDILPFTYVLGVSEKWIKKFEAINLQAPDWYDSPKVFNLSSFGSFMNNSMSFAQNAMSSGPSSSSSVGSSASSGGGSSGGGSGGGGGGSW